MPVSHARVPPMTSADEEVPGLLEVLAQVPDPRRRRGRRFGLVFVLAVAVVCVLAGAKSFREIGDQAADLPQDLLAVLGGRPHPLHRKIAVASEKRIRTLLQALDAVRLDEITGGWLRALAAAGKLEGLLTAIAIDGKWLRGVADGQVKLFAALLHEEGVMIAQHRIPDETNEITQVKELLDPVDLTGAVVTADAAHAQHDTAAYIAGPSAEGGRDSAYLLFVKGNQPGLQRAIYDAIQEECPREPDHAELDYGHGRIIRRSIWVTAARDLDFPHATQVMRIRRDGYDAAGALISKEIVHAVTSLAPGRATPARLARIARGQWGIDISNIGDPSAARRRGGEVTFQQVRRTGLPRRGRDCRAWPLPPGRRASDAQLTHQPFHRAPRHPGALAPQLPPYLPGTIHAAAYFPVFPHAHDLLLQPLIPHAVRRRLTFTLKLGKAAAQPLLSHEALIRSSRVRLLPAS